MKLDPRLQLVTTILSAVIGVSAAHAADDAEAAKWQYLQSQSGAYQPAAGPAPGPVAQGAAGYSGTNAGGPQFIRPQQGVPPPELSISLVNYHVEQFRISANSACTLYSEQDYDGYLHVYGGSFDPQDPMANVLGGDDDVFFNPFRDSQIDIALSTGITYYLVTSAFASGVTGNFTNTITCPDADVEVGAPPLPPTAANLRASMSGPAVPVRSGTAVPVFVRVDNYGPDAAYPPIVTVTASSPPGSMTAGTPPTGWSCEDNGDEEVTRGGASTTALVDQAMVVCTASGNMPRTSIRIPLQVTPPANPPGGFISFGASVESESVDPVPSNNQASFKLYVKPSASGIAPVSPPKD